MSDVDPLTQVYIGLFDTIFSRDFVQEKVRPSNRIQLTGKLREPFRREVSTADLPELRIVPIGSIPHMLRTSGSSSIVEKYSIQISTGSKLVDILYPLKFEIYRALCDWQTIIKILTWKDQEFVKRISVSSINEGVTEMDLNRGIDGWASLWTVEVEMFFATSDLIGDV